MKIKILVLIALFGIGFFTEAPAQQKAKKITLAVM
jgi:hypothetical protein